MDKELIIVRESVNTGAFTLTYYGGKQKFVYNKDSQEVKDFIDKADYEVILLDYETKEIEKIFYCVDEERAQYVHNFLLIDGEDVENVYVKLYVDEENYNIINDGKLYKPTGFGNFVTREFVDDCGNRKQFY